MTTPPPKPARAHHRHAGGLLVLTFALLHAACSSDGSPGATTDMSGSLDADAGGSPDGEEEPSGTWRDPGSGLTWEVRTAYPDMDWAAALQRCDELVAGELDDWRVPTISELRTLIRGCEETAAGGACRQADDCTGAGERCYSGDDCFGCMSGEGPGASDCYWPTEMGTACGWTWSASPADDAEGYICYADYSNGHLSHDLQTADVDHHVVCVRGQRL